VTIADDKAKLRVETSCTHTSRWLRVSLTHNDAEIERERVHGGHRNIKNLTWN